MCSLNSFGSVENAEIEASEEPSFPAAKHALAFLAFSAVFEQALDSSPKMSSEVTMARDSDIFFFTLLFSPGTPGQKKWAMAGDSNTNHWPHSALMKMLRNTLPVI